jgi:hypothetical protein
LFNAQVCISEIFQAEKPIDRIFDKDLCKERGLTSDALAGSTVKLE